MVEESNSKKFYHSDLDEIRAKIIKKEKLHIGDLMSYEKFKRLHEKYAIYYDEDEFALEVLDITPTVLEKLKNNGRAKTYILKNQKLPTEDQIKRTRTIMAEKYFLHQDDEIDYSFFCKIYDEMSGALNEEMFAEMYFSISKSDLEMMRKDSQKRCKVYRDIEIPEDEITRIQQDMKDSREISKPQTTSLMYCLELYRKYPNIFNLKDFAIKVLKMSEYKYNAILRRFNPKYLDIQKYLMQGMNDIEIASKIFFPQSLIQYAISHMSINQAILLANIGSKEKRDDENDGPSGVEENNVEIIEPADNISATITDYRKSKANRDSTINGGRVGTPKVKLPSHNNKDGEKTITSEDTEVIHVVHTPKQAVVKPIDKPMDEPQEKNKEEHIENEPPLPNNFVNFPDFISLPRSDKKIQQLRKTRRTLGRQLRTSCEKIFERITMPGDLTEQNKKTMREYIKNAFERFPDKDVKKDELDDLEECLLTINLKENDIATFSKICVSLGEHKRANGFITRALDVATLTEEDEANIRKLQLAIKHSMKRVSVVSMISKGEKDIRKMARITGLPNSEIMEMYNRLQTDKKYAEKVSYSIEELGE